jgi:fatty-acyl-CoA synthase
VRRARVVGLPDERLGEIVTLCVEPAEGAERDPDELRAFLAERVAPYKVPRIVLFFDPGEIPTTGSDTKIRDDELVALVLERLDTAATTTSESNTEESE